MMPDDHPMRIRVLETRVAELGQHVTDLDQRLNQLVPIAKQQIKLEGDLTRVADDVRECTVTIREIRKLRDRDARERDARIASDRRERDDRIEQERRDLRNNRRTIMLGVGLAVLTTLGSLIVQVIVAAGWAP